MAFDSSMAGVSGATQCCTFALPPVAPANTKNAEGAAVPLFLRDTHPPLPVALFHQCLPLFFAGVFLPLIGLEQDLL